MRQRFVYGWMLLIVLVARDASAVPPGSHDEFVPDPATVTRHGPAYRYPQHGWWVLHIEGRPYERGYQHGRLMAEEIVAAGEALAVSHSPTGPADAWKLIRRLVDALFLRRFADEFLEEMKGIADGAATAGAKLYDHPIDLIDIACINSDFEAYFLPDALRATATGLEGRRFQEPPVGQPIERGVERCSAFAVAAPATRDGQIVFGHVTMSQLSFVKNYNVWLDIQPAAGRRIAMQSFPGGMMSGLDYYLNDAGILLSETTIDQTAFDIRGKSLASRCRQAIQYSETIDQIVDVLRTDNNGLYSNEWLIADTKTGEIAMFELGTQRSRLWRSSRGEWFGDTPGFYWGCNQTKDTAVFAETQPGFGGKPANLLVHPGDRDAKWLALFDRRRGQIGAEFGFEAFTTPPIAAFPTCDAKFTTTALAKEMKSWGLFGPPRGRAWDGSREELARWPGIKPLVPNDWTLLAALRPDDKATAALAVDLKPFKTPDEPASKQAARMAYPAAWHGSLLPDSDADLWLAGGFAEYERAVALEQAHVKHAAGKSLDEAALDDIELARFTPWSQWQCAVARRGSDLPLAQVERSWRDLNWHPLASGKGAMLLARLRSEIGPAKFDESLDAFGRRSAGERVRATEFIEMLAGVHGKSLDELVRPWLHGTVDDDARQGNFWTLTSYEAEREQTLIVFGTAGDVAAQREAASRLQRAVARHWSGYEPPVRGDTELTKEERRAHHLLLVGRPATNRVTESCRQGLPVEFDQDSLRLRGKTYAHPQTAVIAAGSNPWEPRRSVVVFAGLSAEATWHVVDHLPKPDEPQPQVLLRAHQERERRLGAVRFRPAQVVERTAIK